MGDTAQLPAPGYGRREFVLTMLGGGIAAACTPVRMGLKIYPEEFHVNDALVDGTLRAFVLTIIPGLPDGAPDLTRPFYDELFGLAPYRGYLASDLCDRARRLTGEAGFARLPYEQRALIVAAGMAGGGLTTRLYHGAAFAVQVATYASIYDDERGCPINEFEGRFTLEQMAGVPDVRLDRFAELTASGTGNPA